MPIFKNVSGDARNIPALNVTVEDGAEFTVSDDDAEGLRAQPWFTEKVTKSSSAATATSTPTSAATPVDAQPVTPVVDATQGA